MRKNILDRMTADELVIMQTKIDDSDPDRIMTPTECEIVCKQVQLQQKYKMTEAEYWQAKGGRPLPLWA